MQAKTKGLMSPCSTLMRTVTVLGPGTGRLLDGIGGRLDALRRTLESGVVGVQGGGGKSKGNCRPSLTALTMARGLAGDESTRVGGQD